MILNKIITNKNNDSNKLAASLLQAEQYIEASEFTAAYNIYKNIIIKHQNSPEIYNNLAICCHQIQNDEECQRYIDLAINLDPKNAFYLAQKAKFININNFDYANDLYQKAISLAYQAKPNSSSDTNKIKSDYANLLFTYGCVFAKDLNKTAQESAIFLFNKSIENNPDNYKTYFNLACCYINLDNIETGVKYLKKTLAVNPNHSQANFALSQHYQAQNNLAKAEEHLKLSITSKNINLANAEYNYGVLEQQKGNTTEALSHYKKCLEINPKHFAACYNSASIYQKLEDLSQAVQFYQQALTINPEDVTCKYLLSALSNSSNETKTPEQYTEHLFDSYADNFEYELLDALEYKTPEILYNTFIKHLENTNLLNSKLNILDLGCGTGLIGQVFSKYPKLESITGIDLSQNMLNQANKKNIYNHLIKSDINKFLLHQINNDINNNFNLVILADVLVYYGELKEIFEQIKSVLNLNPTNSNKYILFSIEHEKSNSYYKLNQTGRFSHHPDYIKNILEKNDLCLISKEQTILRKNKGEPISGILYMASC